MEAHKKSYINKPIWLPRPRKLDILVFIIIIALQISNLQSYFILNTFIPKVKADGEVELNLNPIKDIFISPSTNNGNRRMLFIGTYSDPTICNNEGCPPIYSNSYSLLNFNWSQVPTNLIVTSAKLRLFHYGSNSNFNLKVSKADSNWDESLSYPGISFSGNFGEANIPNFNTSNPDEIQLREINLNLDFFNHTDNYSNGIVLTHLNNLESPGIALCSTNSDSFCDERYKPILSLLTIPNNSPLKPEISNITSNQVFGGNCDESIQPISENCTEIYQVSFKAKNLIDNDPISGAFSHSKFIIKKGNEVFLESSNIPTNPESNWDVDLENGNYSIIVESYDKKDIKATSDSINFTIDTKTPSIPQLQSLANITKPSSNTININLTSSASTDNLDLQKNILYQVQYSTDSSFIINTFISSWSNSSNINLTQNGADNILGNDDDIQTEKTYFFRMRSKDSHNNISDWSNTSVTKVDGLPKIPQLDKSSWDINRFKSNTFISNSKNFSFTGIAQKNNKVELFVNNTRISDKLANRNCSRINNEDYCKFTISYSYNGQGDNDRNGHPLKSFSIQLRSIDANLNTSVLTSKETFYYDNVKPNKPIIDISTERQYLNDNNLTNGNRLNIKINAERYSDIFYTLLNAQEKIIDSKKLRTPFNKTLTLNSILKVDGKYKVEITSIDGAGNKSNRFVKEFSRDSIGPEIKNLNIYPCEKNICLNLQSEPNSDISINERNFGISNNQGSFSSIITRNFSTNYNYKFKIQLKDKLGNLGNIENKTFFKPLDAFGSSGITGSLALNEPYKGNANIVLSIDSNSNYKHISNDLPTPSIYLIENNGSNSEVIINGIGIPEKGILNANIETRYDISEIIKACGTDIPVFAWSITCLASKLNKSYLNISNTFIEAQSNCLSIDWRIWENSYKDCVKNKVSEKYKTYDRINIDIIKSELKFIKNNSENLNCEKINNCRDYPRVSNNSGYWASFFSNKDLKQNEEIVVYQDLSIKFEINKINLNLSNLKTSLSNSYKVPLPKNNQDEPAGFPITNFNLVKQNYYKNYFGNNLEKICDKYVCVNKSQKANDFFITRGASEYGHNKSDMDFAPDRNKYNLNTPPLLVSTLDGKFIKDKDNYRYGIAKRDANGNYRCIDAREYNSLQAYVISPKGISIQILHLDPKSLNLNIWNEGNKVDIKRGDPIGFMGKTGCSTSEHIHYQIDNYSTSKFYESFYSKDALNLTSEEARERNNRNTPQIQNYLKYYLTKQTISNDKFKF